jgi:hypothetical protein
MACSQGLVVCNLSISYLQEAGSTIRITKVNIIASFAIIDDQNKMACCGRSGDTMVHGNFSAIHRLAFTISSTVTSAACDTTGMPGFLANIYRRPA